MARIFHIAALPAATVVLLAAACSADKNPPCVAVKGKVVLKKSGEPCKGAFVVFHPATKELEAVTRSRRPFATVGDDGTFAVTTFKENDGAPEGQYSVTVVWEAKGKETTMAMGDGGSANPDRLQGRYGNPQQPKLTATIAKGSDNTLNFEIE